MTDINRIFLMGRLSRDPELKTTPAGTSICRFSLCTSKVWKDAEGNRKERPLFHTVVAFDKKAESIEKFFKKGKGIWVEGEIEYREYEKDGAKKQVTEIKLNEFGFVDNGERQSNAPSKPKEDTTKINCDNDDIPF